MFGKNKKTNMEMEIAEQSKTIPYILDQYVDKLTGDINIDLPEIVKKVIIVASGSSYHCARFAVDFIEKYAKVEAKAIYSSEFLLKSVIPHDENTLYIFITQSGETSDTLKSVERVQNNTQLPTLCVTNVENSTIWNMCDYKVSCLAGIESGIAATKSLSAQILCLILIALKIIEKNKGIDATKDFRNILAKLPEVVDKTISKRDEIRKIAKVLIKEDIIVVTSDGIGYSLAKEATLKIKETSYKNISAAIFGEFMHGHVAVLNNKSLLIYIAVGAISKRSSSNLNQIKKDYKAKLLILGNPGEDVTPDYNINIGCDNEILESFANLIAAQLIALEVALMLKRNVDSPKGLHKVVVDKNI